MKIDLDHYQFTDYRKEKVTFNLKGLLDYFPALKNILPRDV